MDVLLPSSPSRNSSEITDYQLEMPAWSYGSLQSAAIQLRLHRPHSLAWAILLHALPPPETDIVKSIKSQRNLYNDLRTRLSQDPRASVDDDPLSQKDESAWKQHFCDNELKALILQDVVRTFPDELYFRDKDVQDLMVRVLFYWARSHAMVGYRQGMHEILAPLLFELHLDRMLAPTSLSDTLKYYLDQDFLEHDSYMLFSAVMKGLERFYTTGEAVPSPGGRLPTSNSLHNPNEVVRYLEHVKDEYLSKVDPELSAHLDQCNITMELFGIRWLRLLFGREFSRGEVPALWGFLFADGPMLPYLHYVIVAMLVSVRDTLLSCDAGGALARLMRAGAAPAREVCAHALHLRRPDTHPRPPRAQQRTPPMKPSPTHIIQSTRRVLGGDSSGSDTEGVAEGADVARELATLAVLRARLPAVAAQLAAAGPAVRGPAETLAQLVALLQCRNHALVDVETALEAAEANTNMNSDRIGRRMLVPVALPLKKRSVEQQSTGAKQAPKVKEVPLKLFHQAECVCVNSDFPCLDPLRLRTE